MRTEGTGEDTGTYKWVVSLGSYLAELMIRPGRLRMVARRWMAVRTSVRVFTLPYGHG
jgi:hypothetical protein